MEGIDAWWDRRLTGAAQVLAAEVSVLLAPTSGRDLTVVGVLVMPAIFCAVFWVARLTFVPFVEVGHEKLRVHNVFETYDIPWRAVRGIRDDPRSGVVADLDDRRTVRLQAFTRWPSFGRHQKLVDRLEVARRAAPAEGGTSSPTGGPRGSRSSCWPLPSRGPWSASSSRASGGC
ncbi:PH domain-containing protein [Streptomyces sp. NPDC094468]|uniref:PH domain-containing protein n=1 Tax=Streptomyces sp. NPDC094468 TaxID=3366066 RepID=UPI0037F21DA1